jgi:hypothetical protein
MMKALISAALIAAGMGLGFCATAQAAPQCSFNSTGNTGSGSHQPICGLPDLSQSVSDSLKNLQRNLDLSGGLKNLQSNVNPGTAAGNLQHNLTHGVGSDDQNAG